MKIFTKESLKAELEAIGKRGWIRSSKPPGNDGAVGNTLEQLLGITENNLPLPDAGSWEIKGQRRGTSLLTLFHMDPPSPHDISIIPRLLIPKYGWPLTGNPNESSFRLTIGTSLSNDRGFRVVLDETNRRIAISFDAGLTAGRHKDWLASVEKRVGLGEINPQPYWSFDELEKKIYAKLDNAFYIYANAKKQGEYEYFWYNGIIMLEGFNFNVFLDLLRKDVMKIDFDARDGFNRPGHNHGTKFRIPRNMLTSLYRTSTILMDQPIDRKTLRKLHIDEDQAHMIGGEPANRGPVQVPLLDTEQ